MPEVFPFGNYLKLVTKEPIHNSDLQAPCPHLRLDSVSHKLGKTNDPFRRLSTDRNHVRLAKSVSKA